MFIRVFGARISLPSSQMECGELCCCCCACSSEIERDGIGRRCGCAKGSALLRRHDDDNDDGEKESKEQLVVSDECWHSVVAIQICGRAFLF